MQPGARGTEGRSGGIRRDGLPAFARVGRRFDLHVVPGFVQTSQTNAGLQFGGGQRARFGRSGRGRRGAKAHPAAAATAQPPAQGAGRKGTFQPEQAGQSAGSSVRSAGIEVQTSPFIPDGERHGFFVAQRPALGKKKSGGGHIVHAVSTDRKGRSASRGRRPLCAGTALFSRGPSLLTAKAGTPILPIH